MARLDIELHDLLITKSLHEKNPGEGAYVIDPDLRLHVSVQFTGSISPLEEAGFVAKDVYGNIAYGTIDVETLSRISQLPSVVSIEKQSKDTIQLDDSIPEVMANNIWSRSGDNFSGYTGQGVIVGIIDTGIDFRHPNFIKPDGTSRIMYIWDQTLSAEGSESGPLPITTPAPFNASLGYGVQYYRDDLTAVLQAEKNGEQPAQPVRHRDEDGHGTHVAGIAAGNGRQSGTCANAYTYIGMAPHADIVAVRLWGLTDGDRGGNGEPVVNAPSPNLVPDALRYILEIGRRLSSPVVINCSFGSFTEQMDGSSNICQDVNLLLNSHSTGRSIVWGAGNDGNSKFHASATVPASGTLDLEFEIHSGDDETRRIIIVYSGSNLEIQVVSPVGGANGTVSWVSSSDVWRESNTANGTIDGGNPGRVRLSNLINLLAVTITPPNEGTPPENGENVSSTLFTDWVIQLRSSNATATPIDAFCTGGSSHDSKSPYFLNHTTSNTTLTHQATGEECVTVGSYKVGGQLAASSGRGPTLDGRTKPELCAPGVDITSATSVSSDEGHCHLCCCECCRDWYVGFSGTSMAAPHVTGNIALMLHKNPNLTHTDIKNRLTAGADGKPGDAPPSDTPGWGAGRLSAINTVNPVPVVNPPIPMVAAPDTLRQPNIIDAFLSTDFGPFYYDLGKKYFHEIARLVNTNKKVATVWHRNRGPSWVRIAINAFHDPKYKIPLTAGNQEIRESLDRFLIILKRYASPELKSDLGQFEEHLQLLQEGMTLPELVEALGNQPPPIQASVKWGS